MKKYLYLMFVLVAGCIFFSCDDDDDIVVDQKWKLHNETVFLAKDKNPEYTKLPSLDNNGNIYYKVIKEGKGREIYYTDSVSVYYKGCILMDKKGNYLYENDDIMNKGIAFDDHLKENSPSVAFGVGGSIIPGWKTALQYMKEGDRWEIWIPQQLGYGYTPQPGIPVCSTLVFDIEVVKLLNR